VNLIIDIGNTLVKIGAIKDNHIFEIHSHPEPEIPVLKDFHNKYPLLKGAIISSVREIPIEFMDYLNRHFSTCVILNSLTPIPLENMYKTKETLGCDRIAACVGANALYPNTPLLVIDAGTAITFDMVDDDKYIGGTISPGLSMRFRALHAYTGKLPHLQKNENYHLIGSHTNDAIISGVQNGIIFEIDGYISHLRVKYPDLKVILTGGDALFFDKKLKSTIFVHPTILLTGLNRILDYNAKL